MGLKDTFFSRNLNMNCRGNLIDLSVPRIMGILNVTPDSFYDGGNYTTRESILNRTRSMIEEGVDIIDVGAFSSRPGADYISKEEELERLLPALQIIRENFPDILISVDTFRTEIAEKVIEDYNVDIINDITAGDGDPEMFDFIAATKVPYIMMHMQGTPANMQKNPQYQDVVDEVLRFINIRSSALLKKGAIDIIIDPGFGFGKTLDHNYSLLAALEVFTSLNMPILIGVSRKSMTYKLLDTGPESALNGTTALHMYSLMKGASILRVHDVKEAVETCKLYQKLQDEETKA
jgi:dihydropteroate synthase